MKVSQGKPDHRNTEAMICLAVVTYTPTTFTIQISMLAHFLKNKRIIGFALRLKTGSKYLQVTTGILAGARYINTNKYFKYVASSKSNSAMFIGCNCIVCSLYIVNVIFK